MSDLSKMSDAELMALYQQEKAKAKTPTLAEGALEDIGGGYSRNAMGQTFYRGPRGGMSQVAGPTREMADTSSRTAATLNTVLAGIDRVDQQLRQTRQLGPLGLLTNPKQLTVVNQSVKDLMLRMKEEPYNLGVLNGPDLQILESVVDNPAALSSALLRGTLQPKLRNLASIYGENYRSEESRFKGVGGRPEALPPLYQSPNSQYDKAAWGHSGLLPPGTKPKTAKPAAGGAMRERHWNPQTGRLE